MSSYSTFRRPGSLLNHQFISPFCPAPEIYAAEDDGLKIVKVNENLKKKPRKIPKLKGSFMIGKLKMFMLGIFCIILAISINAIDDYDKIFDFIETAKIVISFNR
jgi:hypothetical protein